ncbi:Hypothetical protein FKW44_025177 [Caligus rogercresseyi]|uniref:Uncharacterized protein n=1 Tax=Caligus rogercresseyi TaxID=217165 RepID=A0A7T8GL60_CALRO|nr:Hypothetical protein FKW44_025177 [Caligus rogercresseyi]
MDGTYPECNYYWQQDGARGTKLKNWATVVSGELRIFLVCQLLAHHPHPTRLWTMESGALWKAKPVQIITECYTP